MDVEAQRLLQQENATAGNGNANSQQAGATETVIVTRCAVEVGNEQQATAVQSLANALNNEAAVQGTGAGTGVSVFVTFNAFLYQQLLQAGEERSRVMRLHASCWARPPRLLHWTGRSGDCGLLPAHVLAHGGAAELEAAPRP